MQHSLRRLLKSPIFTLTAVLTVGAAIGANALIFSVVNGIILKPLPYADPASLVGVWHVAPGVLPGPLQQSGGTYFLEREFAQSFTDVGLWNDGSVTVTGRGEPEQVESLSVTDGTFPLLGIRPQLGRLISKEDDTPQGPWVAMISHRYWQRAFNGSPAAIGQSLVVNGRGREIVGVLPEDFRFLRTNPAVVLPLKLDRTQTQAFGFNYQGIGRLKPGVTLVQANADVGRLLPTLIDRFPMPPGFTRQMFEATKMGPLVRPLDVDVVGDIGATLWVLLGTVGLVLLVACANVANLFLVRAEARQQELAIRLALGAEGRQVAWQLMAEALLVAAIGGVVGVALAYGGIQLLLYLQPAQLPRLDEISLDPLVLMFTLGISLMAGLVFGAIPIVKYARPRLAATLKDGSRGSSEGRERHHARNTLVIAQVSLATVLLVASGLMIRTFLAIQNVPPGFVHPQDVLTLRLTIPQAVIADFQQTAQAFEQIAHNIQSIGGVQSVGLSSSITMDGNSSNDPLDIEGFPITDGKMAPIRRYKHVGAGYFETMGNPIVAGRGIAWDDVRQAKPVVVINESLAREYWKDDLSKAVGARVRQNESSIWREIVGVVGNERQDGATVAPPATVYWPMAIRAFWDNETYVQRTMGVAIRTSRVQDPAFIKDVQQAVWSVNTNLPLARVRTLQQIYDASMAQTSFVLVILGVAAAVTLLLGLVGIYGVIAYIVSQRRREVGIRMALGAQSDTVQRIFLARGLSLAGVGLAIGLVGAAALMRVLSTLLFGVAPFDPVTYASVAAALGSVALAATWIPARQATRVDPMLALRSE